MLHLQSFIWYRNVLEANICEHCLQYVFIRALREVGLYLPSYPCRVVHTQLDQHYTGSYGYVNLHVHGNAGALAYEWSLCSRLGHEGPFKINNRLEEKDVFFVSRSI